MGIQRLQPVLGDVALKLESRLQELSGTRTVIRLDHALSAFSGDVISRICLGDKNTNEFLDDPDFAPYWQVITLLSLQVRMLIDSRYNMIHIIVRSIPLFTGIPVIVR
jgi:hypothetical protein